MRRNLSAPGLLQTPHTGRVVLGLPGGHGLLSTPSQRKSADQLSGQGEGQRTPPPPPSPSHSDFRAEEEVMSWGFFLLLLFQC